MKIPTHAEIKLLPMGPTIRRVASMGPHAPGSINTIPSRRSVSMATALPRVLNLLHWSTEVYPKGTNLCL
jgi:hypothetical protein